jgi:pyridoxine 5-phosphate synthase
VIKLSVNVNKIATVRNSRGGHVPSVLEAVRVCVDAGAPGITVHPRADERHITGTDVREIAALLAGFRAGAAGAPPVEFNIEGDPWEDLLRLVHEVKPDQCTLVPVKEGELTSEAGWRKGAPREHLRSVVNDLRAAGIRVSLFVDPEEEPIRWAADIGTDRIELYTEPFARAFAAGPEQGRASFETFARAAELAAACGLAVNAGHDLDLENLVLFRRLPHLAEVSIGHALVSRALFVGLSESVREYLQVLAA